MITFNTTNPTTTNTSTTILLLQYDYYYSNDNDEKTISSQHAGILCFLNTQNIPTLPHK